MKNWLKENWFKTSTVFIGFFIAIALFSIAGNYKNTSNTTENTKSATTRFYIKSNIANIRECPSTSCKVLVQYSQNAWWDFPETSNYHAVNDMPDWVSVKWSDEKGNSGNGYIHKSNFSDTPIVVQPNQNQQPNYSTSQKQNSDSSDKQNLPNIIKQWRPAVAYIVCNWRYTNGGYFKAAGSGLYVGIGIITNRHVVEEKGIPAEFCIISLPDDNASVTINTNDIKSFGPNLDAVAMTIKNPTTYMKTISDIIRQGCIDTAPVGTELVVLGYPGIGSLSDITATEGIISGYENDYYITSAKIEHGNSGGVAIWTEKNCNLGIPTSVTVGSVESLGRILDFRSLFINR